jgi:hypothetical protein
VSVADPQSTWGGDILDPGSAARAVDQVVDRHYLFKPKDEDVPLGPDGKPTGSNWFEHNYKPMPPALSLRLSIDPKALADALNPFFEASDMIGAIKLLENAKIKIETQPGNPIIKLVLLP